MTRADLLVNLARAGSRGDQRLFTKTLQAMVAEERAKHHNVLADRLESYIRQSPPDSIPGQNSHSAVADVLLEISPRIRLADLILSEQNRAICEDMIEEQQRAELLRSYGIEPRNRLLLVGPPGNGKTSLAEAMAEALFVPLYSVRYEGVIGSYLGETAVRLRRIFDHVKTRHCVLFLDEFDTLGKERGDVHETGEIKRVVSSLLLQLDDLPSYVVVITATNHPELLDRAVWRRFQAKMILPRPTRSQIVEWISRFEQAMGSPLGYAPRTLADRLHGCNFSELEDFTTDIRRRFVLRTPNETLKDSVAKRLRVWQEYKKVREEAMEDDDAGATSPGISNAK